MVHVTDSLCHYIDTIWIEWSNLSVINVAQNIVEMGANKAHIFNLFLMKICSSLTLSDKMA